MNADAHVMASGCSCRCGLGDKKCNARSYSAIPRKDRVDQPIQTQCELFLL